MRSSVTSKTILARGRELARDERGGVSLEYVTILIVVAIIAIGAWASFGRAVENDASNEYQTFGYPPE